MARPAAMLALCCLGLLAVSAAGERLAVLPLRYASMQLSSLLHRKAR
jgi:hypothetical protein